jgi:hypothetical protein
MGDENKIRDAADAIKGVVEAVPVYQDVVQPAAKEIGTALQTVAKTVHIALAPVSALVWGFEKIRDYLHDTLTEKLKNVPPERILTPSPTIAGPTVEALRFAAHEPSLREMYANLLATSMDAKTVEEAHPAFVEIIRQLTPDEARLLEHLLWGEYSFYIKLFSGHATFTVEGTDYVHDFRRLTGCGQPERDAPWHYSYIEHPNLIHSYIDNLTRLGMVEILQSKDPKSNGSSFESVDLELLVLEDAKESVMSYFQLQEEELVFDLRNKIVSESEYLYLTSLGKQFCKACVKKDTHS